MPLTRQPRPSLQALRSSSHHLPSPRCSKRTTADGGTWFLNDLWHQLQQAIDPFEGLEKAQPPTIRTTCFPFPGTVTIAAADGLYLLGDVIVTVALWIEAEQVLLDAAKKVEYASDERSTIQRVEFGSRRSEEKDWRISLQMPEKSTDIADFELVAVGQTARVGRDHSTTSSSIHPGITCQSGGLKDPTIRRLMYEISECGNRGLWICRSRHTPHPNSAPPVEGVLSRRRESL